MENLGFWKSEEEEEEDEEEEDEEENDRCFFQGEGKIGAA